MASTQTNRIDGLDGLRGVAILAVLAYHFCYSAMPPRTDINYYPFTIDEETIARYGRYGVELFFIISGFVITMTLQRCTSLTEFVMKRFARLWPSMALCSVLTFAIVSAWSGPQLSPNLWRNFLPSWTFTDPHLWSLVTGERFHYVDRVYWTLFVEVRFYALAALFYFFTDFWVAFPIFSAVAMGLFYMTHAPWVAFFCVADQLPWFLIGVGLCKWNRAEWWESVPMRVLSWKPLAQIGAASYSLYLLHENIGIVGMNWLAQWTGPSPWLPVLVGIALIGFSQAAYRYWEQPMNRWIVSRFNRWPAVAKTSSLAFPIESAKTP